MKLPFSRKKESTTSAATIARYLGKPIHSAIDMAAYAREGYQSNPDIKTAVDKKASAAAGIKIIVQRLTKTDGAEEWEAVGGDHPLQKLLDRPNPRQGNSAFVFEAFANRSIYGNNFTEMVGPKNRPPMELYNLPVQNVKVVGGNSIEMIGGYEFKTNGNTVKLDAAKVLHWKTYHPTDPFYGMSPLEAAAKLVDQASAAYDWNLSMLQNGGVPSGFLKNTKDAGGPSRKEMRELRESIDQNWGGAHNAGRPGILPGGYDWQSAGKSPEDMQFLGAQTVFARKFAMVIGVPPELVDGEQKKFSNYGEARRSLYEEGVLPDYDLWLDDLNPWLCPLFQAEGERLRIVIDKDDIEALAEQRDALYKRASDAWFLTVNQKLRLVGEEPLEGEAGNVVLVPSGLLPLELVAGTSAPREPETDGGPSADDAAADDEEPAPVAKSKALNLGSEERKTAYWKLVDAKRARVEQVALGIVQKRMDAEIDAIFAAVSNAAGPLEAIVATTKAIDSGRDAWLADYSKLYMAVGKPFAEAVLTDLKGDTVDHVKAAPKWQGILARYLGRVGGAKVTQVTQTTKDAIAAAINAGVAEGEGIPVLAKRVQGALVDASKSRALTIARTETVSASNAASQAAAESTGLPLVKEWISTRDNVTRSSHVDMDGMTAGMDEPFTVNGDELDFPGDSSHDADAGEIINCRCTQAFATDG